MKYLLFSMILSASTLSFAGTASFTCGDISLSLSNTECVEIANVQLVHQGTLAGITKISTISLDSGIVTMDVITKGNRSLAFRNLGSKKCLNTAKVKNKESAYLIIRDAQGNEETLNCQCSSTK